MSLASKVLWAGVGSVAIGTGFAFAAAPAVGLGANLTAGFTNACWAWGHVADAAGVCLSYGGEQLVHLTA